MSYRRDGLVYAKRRSDGVYSKRGYTTIEGAIKAVKKGTVRFLGVLGLAVMLSAFGPTQASGIQIATVQPFPASWVVDCSVEAFNNSDSLNPWYADGNDDAIRAKALELNAGITDQKMIHDRNFRYVVENVQYDLKRVNYDRYVKDTITTLDDYFNAKYGVCEQMSLMVVAMDKAHGINSKVLYNENHALVGTEIDGVVYFSDPASFQVYYDNWSTEIKSD